MIAAMAAVVSTASTLRLLSGCAVLSGKSDLAVEFGAGSGAGACATGTFITTGLAGMGGTFVKATG